MDSTTDASAPSHRIRFELIFGSVWLAVGLFLLPAVIFWVGIAMLGPYGEGQAPGWARFMAISTAIWRKAKPARGRWRWVRSWSFR